MKLDSFIQDVNSWDDFKRKLKDQPKHIKGALFEQWTRCFLQYYPIYREKLKNVWLLKDVPSAVRFKLNIPSSDQGIDLIAETREGSYWAIQCKYLQDESNKLSHRALSTFISLSTGIANNISLCLVCTTADDIPPIYKGKKNIAFVSSDEWNKLDADYFDWLKSGYQYPPPKPIPFKPRAHQVKAIAEAKDHFITREERRGKLIFPCGSGKSLVGYWINKEFNSSSVIVALPSLALVKQTLEIYLREAVADGEELYFLCVCSDQGIGRSDDVLTHTNDLGVECVTDPDKIGSWLIKNKSKKTIIFTTYQSGRAVSEACDQIDHVFDLGIFDEAHKTVGDKDGLFSHLLSDENIRIQRRVFMTATERRYQGTSDTILSMDNHNVYGETFSHLSFKEAIELKLLSDYKIITLLISNEEVKDLIRTNAFVKPKVKGWNEVTEARTIAAMIALRKAMTEYPIHHALTFHSSIQKAESFKENQFVINTLDNYCTPVDAYHVSGAMPTGERSRIVNDFKNSQKGIITNARCLTEGVDVPQIDCVLFADPRKSTVDIVQAAGRALRKHPGKEFGYIILPVFTNSNKTEEIIQSQEFSDILIVLRALAANDERIVEYFRSKNNEGANKEESHQLLTTNYEKLGTLIDPEALYEKVELAIWNKLAKISWRPFEEAREFVHNLKLKSQQEWRTYSKTSRPQDIPGNPDSVYKEQGWISMGDWLGTGKIADQNINYLDFYTAREFVHSLGLKTGKEWKLYCKSKNKHPLIPLNAQRRYQGQGWISMGDWLGTESVANYNKMFREFNPAREFVRSLKLSGQKEWNTYCKSGDKPSDIPQSPHNTYKNKGWVSYGDWLGNGKVATREIIMLPFSDARRFVQKLNLKNQKEWNSYCKSGKKPVNIPSNPQKAYSNEGWISLGDWLGTGTVAAQFIKYMTFKDAKLVVQKLGLQSKKDWKQWCKDNLIPSGIPKTPYVVYKDQWQGWSDFLGTKSST